MATPVTHYQLEWVPEESKGRIIASTGSGPGHNLQVESASEFAALAIILSKPAVRVSGGVFSTGKIPIGT